MKALTLYLPDSLEISESDMQILVACRLFEQGKLSSGQAAEMLGLTKRIFLERLGSYGVSVFNSPLEELESDVRNA